MSDNGQVLSIAHQLALLRSIHAEMEQLAAEYHAALRPVRDALQAVADAPLDDRSRWVTAVSALVKTLIAHELGDTLTILMNNHQCWHTQLWLGNTSQAIAGEAFVVTLSAVMTRNTTPAEFFDRLDQYPFLDKNAAVGEIVNVLSFFMYEYTRRTAPRFAQRYREIRDRSPYDIWTLPTQAGCYGISLSALLWEAIDDWDEALNPKPLFRRKIGRTAPPLDTPPTGKQRSEEGKPSRCSRAEAEQLVRGHLRKVAATGDVATITRDGVAEALGLSRSMVSRTAAWQAFQERRRSLLRPGNRDVPLTNELLAVLPGNDDSELQRLIDEQAADREADERRVRSRRC